MKMQLTPDPPLGSGNDWTATLPEEYQALAANKGWKAPVDALKSYRELDSLLGQKRVLAPDANWKDEQWQEYYKSIGRPETADKYELPKDFKFPEGLELAPDKLKAWQGRFHKYGLLPRQADALLRDYLTEEAANHTNTLKSIETQNAQATQALKEAWGDNYGANAEVVKAVIRKFGDEQTVAQLDQLGADKIPGVFQFLHKIGASIMEDSARGGSLPLAKDSPASAVAEITQLTQDKDFWDALNNRDNPGHAGALARWEQLHRQAYPNEQQSGRDV